MQHVTPFLWFDTQAEEAANFYVSLFDGAELGVVSRYGDGAPLPKGTVMTVSFKIGGTEFVALNGGPRYQFTEAVSFAVTCKTQEEIDRYWTALTQGGSEQMCGWLKDRYGLSWQIVPEGIGEMLKHPKAVEAMLGMRKLDITRLRTAAQG